LVATLRAFGSPGVADPGYRRSGNSVLSVAGLCEAGRGIHARSDSADAAEGTRQAAPPSGLGSSGFASGGGTAGGSATLGASGGGDSAFGSGFGSSLGFSGSGGLKNAASSAKVFSAALPDFFSVLRFGSGFDFAGFRGGGGGG
jgi:hypothetical protein